MFLRLDSGRIKQGAVNVGKNTGFIIEQRTVGGWDQVQIPNAVAERFARFILKAVYSKLSKEARDKRKPLPPGDLVGALHDEISKPPRKARGGKAGKAKARG